MSIQFIRLVGGLLLCWLLNPAVLFAQAVEPADSATKDLQIVEKTVPANQYLYTRHMIENVEEVTRLEWLYGRKLPKRLTALDLTATGPIEYHLVFGTPMYLDIAIPIEQLPVDPGEDSYKQTLPFKCLAMVFKGSPLEASEQWSVLQAELANRGLEWNRQNREIAVNREGFDAQQHVTELQVGIQAGQ